MDESTFIVDYKKNINKEYCRMHGEEKQKDSNAKQ